MNKITSLFACLEIVSSSYDYNYLTIMTSLCTNHSSIISERYDMAIIEIRYICF